MPSAKRNDDHFRRACSGPVRFPVATQTRMLDLRPATRSASRAGLPFDRSRVERAVHVSFLYRDKYFDLNLRHFHEKLGEEHQIGLSYTSVKQGLQAAGLVKRKAKRSVHRKRRERRPLPGMMLHIDGSDHQWFQDERRHDLIVILDDATSEIYYAQLAEEETHATVMAGLRAVIEQGAVLFALFRPWGPFLADAEERWQGRL